MDTYNLARDIAKALVEDGAAFEVDCWESDSGPEAGVDDITQRGVDLVERMIAEAVTSEARA